MNNLVVPEISSTRQHNNIVEAELVESVRWWIKIRWIAGVSVIIATWGIASIIRLGAQQLVLSAIGAGILAYNLVFWLYENRLRRTGTAVDGFFRLAKWQVSLDWLAMALLIHFSGGVESPVIMFFFLHIIIAAIFFPPRTALTFTLLAVGLLTSIALLELSGVLTHAPIVGLLAQPYYQNGLYVFAVLFFFASTAFMVSYITSTIHVRLRRREDEILRLTQNLQRATLRLQALNDGARVVGSTLELNQVLNRLVRSTAQAMNVHACSIRLLDESKHRLEPVAVHGLSQAYLNKGPVELRTNPLARQVLAGKVVNIPDVPGSPLLQYPEEARQEGIKSMLSAPLVGKDGPLGVIRAYAIEPNRFTPDDEAFLEAIAAQGSIAIENAIAYHKVEAIDAARSHFIHIVTHELRSPVSVTQSLLRNIVAGYAGEVSEQQLDILNRATRRVEFLQKLIDDLLDLAAAKSEVKTHEKLGPVPVEAAIKRVIMRFEVPAHEKGLVLEWDNVLGEATSTAAVLATPDGLDQVLNNLVSNAIKYTPSGGRVTVTCAQTDSDCLICVADTGIGIPEEARGHLFEEFYRAPNAKSIEQQGTGLGLTIVRDLVSRFEGDIIVQSTPQKGSKFIVTLPIAQSASICKDDSGGDDDRA